MSLQTKLQLKEREQILDIIQPSTWHHWWIYFISASIFGTSLFFAFWLWGHSWWGRALLFAGVGYSLYLAFRTWYIDRASCLVVTNERIIDIHRHGWFKESVSTVGFSDLDDVVVERNGLGSALFGYGHLHIHPRQKNFILEVARIPRPHAVQTLLFEKRDRFTESARTVSKSTLYTEMLKSIPEFSETELTILYQKIHDQLLALAKPPVV